MTPTTDVDLITTRFVSIFGAMPDTVLTAITRGTAICFANDDVIAVFTPSRPLEYDVIIGREVSARGDTVEILNMLLDWIFLNSSAIQVTGMIRPTNAHSINLGRGVPGCIEKSVNGNVYVRLPIARWAREQGFDVAVGRLIRSGQNDKAKRLLSIAGGV